MSHKLSNIMISIVSIFVVILTWEVLAWCSVIDINFFPPPHQFISNALMLLRDFNFLINISFSFYRLFISTLISLPLALVLGIFTGSSKIIDKIISPLVAFTYPLPKAALLPLMVLIFGMGDSSKIALISIGMFFLLFIQIQSGTRALYQSNVMEVVQIYQIKSINFLINIIIKGIFPSILIGLKTAIGYGLVLVVVSEFNMSTNGIGHFIWESWEQFRIVDMYSALLILSIIGVIISISLENLNKSK